MRGLKQKTETIPGRCSEVAPFVGAWIETRTLYIDTHRSLLVAPFVGAWIETLYLTRRMYQNWSHPLWVRGLKLTSVDNFSLLIFVAPFVGAWIETFESLEQMEE